MTTFDIKIYQKTKNISKNIYQKTKYIKNIYQNIYQRIYKKIYQKTKIWTNGWMNGWIKGHQRLYKKKKNPNFVILSEFQILVINIPVPCKNIHKTCTHKSLCILLVK